MKSCIIYSTLTGHSKKIANAISNELNIPAFNIKEEPKLEEVDLLFIVSGIYSGVSLETLTNYCKELTSKQTKKVALITSCLDKRSIKTNIEDILIKNNIDVLEDKFICKGNFLFFGLPHPTKTDVANAISYAKNILSKEDL